MFVGAIFHVHVYLESRFVFKVIMEAIQISLVSRCRDIYKEATGIVFLHRDRSSCRQIMLHYVFLSDESLLM